MLQKGEHFLNVQTLTILVEQMASYWDKTYIVYSEYSDVFEDIIVNAILISTWIIMAT